MGYLCATCGGVGGLFETSHAHSDKDSCITEVKAANAKLRAELDSIKCIDTARLIAKAVEERDSALLQVEEARKAWAVVKDWVGCDDRGAPEAEREISAQVEALERALALTPKYVTHADGSYATKDTCNCATDAPCLVHKRVELCPICLATAPCHHRDH